MLKKEDIINWLNEYEIKNYIINEDLTVDAEIVSLYDKNLKDIPVKFNKVLKFYCSNNYLTNLNNMPNECYLIDFSHNNINDISQIPKKVVEIHANNNNIQDISPLKNISNKVKVINLTKNNITQISSLPEFKNINYNDNHLYLSHNNITSLENIPNKLFANLYINNNFISDFNNGPQVVYGDLTMDSNTLTTLKNMPYVDGTISVCNNHLISLEGIQDNIKNLFIDDNKITNFDFFPIFVSSLSMRNNNIKIEELYNFNTTLENSIFHDFSEETDIYSFLNLIQIQSDKKELIEMLECNKNNNKKLKI